MISGARATKRHRRCASADVRCLVSADPRPARARWSAAHRSGGGTRDRSARHRRSLPQRDRCNLLVARRGSVRRLVCPRQALIKHEFREVRALCFRTACADSAPTHDDAPRRRRPEMSPSLILRTTRVSPHGTARAHAAGGGRRAHRRSSWVRASSCRVDVGDGELLQRGRRKVEIHHGEQVLHSGRSRRRKRRRWKRVPRSQCRRRNRLARHAGGRGSPNDVPASTSAFAAQLRNHSRMRPVLGADQWPVSTISRMRSSL